LQASSKEALQLQRAEYEKQVQNRRAESASIVQRVRDEHREKRLQTLLLSMMLSYSKSAPTVRSKYNRLRQTVLRVSNS